MSRPVVIVDYDPQWPIIYEEEKHRILRAVGHKVLAIEHIGSTAVPSLGAKPIVDMMAGVIGPTDADECLPLLKPLGYDDVTPEPENPDWYYCLGKGKQGEHSFHLHLMRFNSEFWKRHLIFRDFLRTHPQVALEYYKLKKRLATQFGADREGYTNAKTAFIESTVSRAVGKSTPQTQSDI